MPRSISTQALRHIAASLGVPPRLAPFLPELFRGFTSLGSRPQRLVTALARAGIGPRSRVLDLACGKGALAVALVARTGCHVIGVDAFAPFIDEASALSRRRAVARRCTFIVGDVRRPPLAPDALFDGAVMVGLFGAGRAASLLRRWTRPGGVYLLDDAVRAPGVRAAAFRAVPALEESRRVIERRGDTIVREIALARSFTPAHKRRTRRALVANAHRVAVAHPRLSPLVDEFLSQQHAAEQALARSLCPLAWVVRRGSG